ncbi:MAG: hypothetical protein HC831_16605 [Chloroflexia bacterium]|nr:hypothetical protein [Chloroflexia bacterium]
MSDNNLHKIFANTACVSTEIMMDYLNGKLSEKEKNKVEVHIASCEMCRDEFEGLSLLEDKSKLAAIVGDLDEKIDKRINEGGKKIPLFRNVYRIAAAIIILISSAWFISLYVDSSVSNMDESVVSQAMEEKAETDDGFDKDKEPIAIEQEKTFERDLEKKDNIEKTNKAKTVAKENLSRTSDELKTIITDNENKAIAEGYTEKKLEEKIPVEEFSASVNDKISVEEDKSKNTGELPEEKTIVQKEQQKLNQLDDLREDENEEIVADYVEVKDEKLDRKATRGENRRNRLSKGKETKKMSIEDRDSAQTISLTQKQYCRGGCPALNEGFGSSHQE